jgi:hypothetical protein
MAVVESLLIERPPLECEGGNCAISFGLSRAIAACSMGRGHPTQGKAPHPQGTPQAIEGALEGASAA